MHLPERTLQPTEVCCHRPSCVRAWGPRLGLLQAVSLWKRSRLSWAVKSTSLGYCKERRRSTSCSAWSSLCCVLSASPYSCGHGEDHLLGLAARLCSQPPPQLHSQAAAHGFPLRQVYSDAFKEKEALLCCSLRITSDFAEPFLILVPPPVASSCLLWAGRTCGLLRTQLQVGTSYLSHSEP